MTNQSRLRSPNLRHRPRQARRHGVRGGVLCRARHLLRLPGHLPGAPEAQDGGGGDDTGAA